VRLERKEEAKTRRQALVKVDQYLTETIKILNDSLKRDRPPEFPEMSKENVGLINKTKRDFADSIQTWLRYNLKDPDS